MIQCIIRNGILNQMKVYFLATLFTSVFDDEEVLCSEDLSDRIEKSPTDKADRVQESSDMSPADISYQTHGTNLHTSERCLPVDSSVTSANNDSNSKQLAPLTHVKKNHSVSNVIGEIDRGIVTRKKTRPDYTKISANVCFTSTIESSIIRETLQDNQWIEAKQEELNQFERNQVWELTPRPGNVNIIRTKVDLQEQD
ncbi:putative mitochondrial protein [Cucumis melo var. makuwa]|uniref:Mitochondrial protein n=1 Tax=Cucumis melo var. makuwa TaxID=1194695 RepID=A0A5A7TDT4_CUCMM|nr:putative mitochondrial protein [Cucumis melo var. makuwa]